MQHIVKYCHNSHHHYFTIYLRLVFKQYLLPTRYLIMQLKITLVAKQLIKRQKNEKSFLGMLTRADQMNPFDGLKSSLSVP